MEINYIQDKVNDISHKIAKKYDERVHEILSNYFGNVPNDFDGFGEWIQDKRNQGYSITLGQDLENLLDDKQYHFLTIKYDKEIVLKECILVVNVDLNFERDIK